ncbi:MAG: hypothetical protein ABL977_01685 [Candidatus Eisenbacteria bacterium]
MLHRGVFALLAIALLALPGATPQERDADPLRAEIVRWSTFAHDTTSTDDFSQQVKPGSAPVLEQALAQLGHGRRWYALHRFAAVYANLGAAERMAARSKADLGAPAFERDHARLEREWTRELLPPAPAAFASLAPAAVRAVAEAAAMQVRPYFESSLEYGRSTEPGSGLFYMSAALAQHDFVAFCRRLSDPATARRTPQLRSIRSEIDRLQAQMIAEYQPPLSVDRHAEFIGASAALKEARALDERGLHHGALLRYLQAVARNAPLHATPTTLPPESLRAVLARYEVRFAADASDHSIGELFVQLGLVNAEAAPGTSPPLACAIATQVLPAYLAALAPAPAARTPVAALATVTLVRWPFT